MPQTYYIFPDTNYPPLALAVVDRIKLYIYQKLYPNEAITDIDKRIFITDMTSEMGMREGVKNFDWSSARFPFTVYNIGGWEPFTGYINHPAKSKKYFSSIHNTTIYARPLLLNIPMIHFFHTAADWDRARQILTEDASIKTLLTVPITINGILTSTDAFFQSLEISKGSYAWEFAQQLIVGNIFDLVTNFQILYYEIITDADNVFPVDDILFSLGALETMNAEEKIWFTRNQLSPDTPEITTSPVSGAADVLVDTPIILSFNTPMIEQSVEDALSYNPAIDAEYVWNSSSTQLAISHYNDLTSGTAYEITIENTAKSGEEIPLENDYIFSFTTIG
jgi:hypothetical protein